MTIALRIENFDQLPDGGPVTYQVRGRSFEIGREQHLDWTLPDPNRVISGRHCEVRYEKGGYWLYDVSRNGTFLNNSGSRMKSPHRLESGDRLQIGHYLIAVEVRDEASEAADPPVARAGGDDSIWDIGGQAPAPLDRRAFMPEPRHGQRAPDFSQEYVDLPDMRPQPPPPAGLPFGEPVQARPVHAGAAASGDARVQRGPFQESPFGAASPDRAPPYPLPPVAPESFVQQAPRIKPTAPEPPSQFAPVSMPPAAPLADHRSATAASVLRALADGAGLPAGTLDHRDPEEVALEIGTVLKIVMEQLSVLLKARAAAKVMAKSSRRTMVSAEGNNPLKFIPTSAEIIEVMFARRRPGYLDAQRSVEEAFADLQSHEMATFAAMQKALASLLEGLSPQAIEAKIPGSAFSSKKARAWDVFVERWDAKTDPYENGMLDVFLAYFAEAYDEAARKR
jgi:type VI secretion system protein ImpI